MFLGLLGIPIEGPTNICCDIEAVYKNTPTLESTLSKKKQHSIGYHLCREKVTTGISCRLLAKEDTKTNLVDIFTKCIMTKPKHEELIGRFMFELGHPMNLDGDCHH